MKYVKCIHHTIDHREGEEEFSANRKIKPVWTKVQGGGKIWLYPINIPNPGDLIHMWSPSKSKGGFQGYGGSTLTFPMEDGSEFECKGPWHSNSEALLKATGVDLTEKHLTFVIISRGQEYDGPKTILKNILYMDLKPMVGKFERGRELAKAFANNLGEKVYLYSKSDGGSSTGSVYPEEQEERI